MFSFRDYYDRNIKDISEIIYLGFVLISYLTIIFLLRNSSGSMLNFSIYLLPNIWLLFTSYFWIRKHYEGKMEMKRVIILTVLLISILAISLICRRQDIGSAVFFKYFAFIVLIPVAEEVYFRGLLFHNLIRSIKLLSLSSFLVVILFTFLHFPVNISDLLVFMIFSLILCILTILFKNIIGAIIFHSLWNAFPFIYELIFILPKYYLIIIIMMLSLVIIVRDVEDKNKLNEFKI